MTLKEIKNQIQAKDNEINRLIDQKRLNFLKTQPHPIDTSRIIVDGGKREDKFAKYIIKDSAIDPQLDLAYEEKWLLEEFLDEELKRLDKYGELVKQIVYYKEDYLEEEYKNGKTIFRELTWKEIAKKVSYSADYCRKVYRKYKGKRDIY